MARGKRERGVRATMIEALESRQMLATAVQNFTDIDGDVFRFTASSPTGLPAMTLVAGAEGARTVSVAAPPKTTLAIERVSIGGLSDQRLKINLFSLAGDFELISADQFVDLQPEAGQTVSGITYAGGIRRIRWEGNWSRGDIGGATSRQGNQYRTRLEFGNISGTLVDPAVFTIPAFVETFNAGNVIGAAFTFHRVGTMELTNSIPASFDLTTTGTGQTYGAKVIRLSGELENSDWTIQSPVQKIIYAGTNLNLRGFSNPAPDINIKVNGRLDELQATGTGIEQAMTGSFWANSFGLVRGRAEVLASLRNFTGSDTLSVDSLRGRRLTSTTVLALDDIGQIVAGGIQNCTFEAARLGDVKVGGESFNPFVVTSSFRARVTGTNIGLKSFVTSAALNDTRVLCAGSIKLVDIGGLNNGSQVRAGTSLGVINTLPTDLSVFPSTLAFIGTLRLRAPAGAPVSFDSGFIIAPSIGNLISNVAYDTTTGSTYGIAVGIVFDMSFRRSTGVVATSLPATFTDGDFTIRLLF